MHIETMHELLYDDHTAEQALIYEMYIYNAVFHIMGPIVRHLFCWRHHHYSQYDAPAKTLWSLFSIALCFLAVTDMIHSIALFVGDEYGTFWYCSIQEYMFQGQIYVGPV
jgi:hypothetical protein